MSIKAVKRLVPTSVKRHVKEVLGITRLEQEVLALHGSLERNTEEQSLHASTLVSSMLSETTAINLDLFRVEGKTTKETRAVYAGNGITVRITPQEQYPFTHFRVESASGVFDEPLLYSHLGLARLITEYDFTNIIEIGSRNGVAARAFSFLGKEVYTVEVHEGYKASYTGDYVDIQFPMPVDAIWCSHVLEHQRNVGRFCEKLYDDLKEGGILALTVPTSLSPLLIGHCNIFTPLHLIYNLILAGFDCSDARLKCYDWQMTVLVRKTPNGIPRIGFATTHHSPSVQSDPEMGSNPKLLQYFPKRIADGFTPAGHIWGEIDAINW